MLAKMSSVAADFFVVDLEDGVAPVEKASARENVRRAVARGELRSVEWGLRVNHHESEWFAPDERLVDEVRPPVVVLPKAEFPTDVAGFASRRGAAGPSLALMIETATGVGRVRELAALPPVRALFYGSADLRRSLGSRPGPDRTWERHAMSEILLGARMAGCDAIDAVTFEFRNEERLAADARVARELGFDGKSCIHPAQLETIHRVFSSTPEEITWAERVRDVWERDNGDRTGVVVIDGEMIEALHLDIAHRLLARRP